MMFGNIHGLQMSSVCESALISEGTDRLLRPRGGGGGLGFLKNRVYEYFTPKKIFQKKVLPPTAMKV